MLALIRFLLLYAPVLVFAAITTAPPPLFAIDGIATHDSAGNIYPPQEDAYAPTRFGIPETIGGYSVSAVLTEDNFPCIKPGVKRLFFQSRQPTIVDGPRDFPRALVEKEIQPWHFGQPVQWEATVVGPGVTRDLLVRQFEEAYRFYNAHGCHAPTLSLPSIALAAPNPCPLISGSETTGGERRCISLTPGFTIIQNRGPITYPNANAQSVILIAPDFRDGQRESLCSKARYPAACSPSELALGGSEGACAPCGGYTGVSNNVLTDKGYVLQVGLYLTSRKTAAPLSGNPPDIPADCVLPDQDPGNPFSPNGVGYVVFAGAPVTQALAGGTDVLRPQALCVPYVPGHPYYTTITYTSGTWWTCAADIQDTTTYRCREHPGARATGSTRLIDSPQGTNVFFESWNHDAGRPWGLPPQVVAYGARIYVDGKPYSWPAQLTWTQHSCNDKSWPPESAIVRSLVPDGQPSNDGYAFFNTNYTPPFCN